MEYEGVPIQTAIEIFRAVVNNPAIQDAIIPYSVAFIDHTDTSPGTSIVLPPYTPGKGAHHIGGLIPTDNTRFQRLGDISKQLGRALDRVAPSNPLLALTLPLRFDPFNKGHSREEPIHFPYGIDLIYFETKAVSRPLSASDLEAYATLGQSEEDINVPTSQPTNGYFAVNTTRPFKEQPLPYLKILADLEAAILQRLA